jgi:hypothetical protein
MYPIIKKLCPLDFRPDYLMHGKVCLKEMISILNSIEKYKIFMRFIGTLVPTDPSTTN